MMFIKATRTQNHLNRLTSSNVETLPTTLPVGRNPRPTLRQHPRSVTCTQTTCSISRPSAVEAQTEPKWRNWVDLCHLYFHTEL